MLAGDAVLVNLAFLSAYILRIELQVFRPVGETYQTPLADYLPLAAGLTVMQLALFGLGGAYDLRRNTTWLGMMGPIVQGVALSVLAVIVATFLDALLLFSRLLIVYNAALVVIALGVGRAVWGLALAHLRRRGAGVARVLIVGAGEVGRTVLRTIIARPELGFRVVGFVDDHPERSQTDMGAIRALGPIGNVQAVLDQETVDEVIITLPWSDHQRILGLVQVCEARGVRPRIVPDLFQLSLTSVDVNDLDGIPLIGTRVPSLSGANALVKRIVDLALGVPLTLLSLPLMAVIAAAIKLDSPGPVLFQQVRLGMNGQPFRVYKFRSMRSGAEAEVRQLLDRNEASGPLFKIRDDPRRTRVGRFLRRTSFDEMPQLINVLRGEMSLVGPRPPLPSEVDQYKPWHKQRLLARPGMTGLSQVSGRSDLSFDETVLLDIHYIENWSLPLDAAILLRTIPRVVLGNGAY